MNRRHFIAGALATFAATTGLARALPIVPRAGCVGWWWDGDDYHAAVVDRDLYDRMNELFVACTKPTIQPDIIVCSEHFYATIREMLLKDGAYL